jgi:hypothetical protein
MKRLLFILAAKSVFLFGLNDCHIITLGENCRITYVLISLNLKQESYPFEWKIVNFEALYNCLEDDFYHFSNPDFFVPYFDQRSPVNKYGIVLAHDFPVVTLGFDENGNERTAIDPNWLQLLPEVQEKYRRRIDRFHSVCLSNKKVFFVRYLGTTKRQARNLIKLIASRYPHLDFTLLCINHGTDKAVPWKIPRVKNYNINASTEFSEPDKWREIFVDAGLISD